MSGLSLASIAFLAERKIEITADHANPVLSFVLGSGLGGLATVELFSWGEVMAHLFLNNYYIDIINDLYK